MWLSFGKQGSLASLTLLLGLLGSLVGAAMSPPEITVACHGLARMACTSMLASVSCGIIVAPSLADSM